MMDVFGKALLDHYHDTQTVPLFQRDGMNKYKHRVGEFYFREFTDEPTHEWIDSRLDGPLLDVGAGAGRDALYFQEKFKTTALEISQPLVQLLKDRGVNDVCQGNMFSLSELFEPNTFTSILINGTQIGLVKSRQGLKYFLDQLEIITQPTATVVFDCYDPTHAGAEQMLGFRSDPTPGLAFRVYHYEYEGNVGNTLLFRLFSIERFRRVLEHTNWVHDDFHRPHNTYHLRIALKKASTSDECRGLS